MSVEFDDPFGDLPEEEPVFPRAPETSGSPEVPAFPVSMVGESESEASHDFREPEGEVRVPAGGPVAGGRRVPVPAPRPFPAWPDPSLQDQGDAADGQVDYSDLAAINRDLMQLRVRMSRVRRAMRAAARDAAEAKARHQRAYRRALLQQSGGSAESRKAAAEIACEELEADMQIKQQVADELVTLFRSVRDDVENAKVAAFNLRALSNLL